MRTVRRETGKEQMVEVHCDESVANCIGPESCAVAREGNGEALTGESIGQPLSRESFYITGADSVVLLEGNMAGCVIASARPTRRGRRPWHVQTPLAREPGDLTPDRSAVWGHASSMSPPVRIGKVWSRSR